MEFTKSIHAIFDKLQSFLRSETVIGEPIQIGSVTLVPVISVSFGAGSGGGVGKDTCGNNGTGGGAGAGGKITPNAILVIKNDEVSIITINNSKGSFEKVVESIPDIISTIKFEKNE